MSSRPRLPPPPGNCQADAPPAVDLSNGLDCCSEPTGASVLLEEINATLPAAGGAMDISAPIDDQERLQPSLGADGPQHSSNGTQVNSEPSPEPPPMPPTQPLLPPWADASAPLASPAPARRRGMSAHARTTLLINLSSVMERVDEQLLPALYSRVGRSLAADPQVLGWGGGSSWAAVAPVLCRAEGYAGGLRRCTASAWAVHDASAGCVSTPCCSPGAPASTALASTWAP